MIKKDKLNNLIYTGCQIINKDLFKSYSVHNFSISEIWNNLIESNSLYGFESLEQKDSNRFGINTRLQAKDMKPSDYQKKLYNTKV